MHSVRYDNSIIPDRDEAATAVRRPGGWDRAEALLSSSEKKAQPPDRGVGLEVPVRGTGRGQSPDAARIYCVVCWPPCT